MWTKPPGCVASQLLFINSLDSRHLRGKQSAVDSPHFSAPQILCAELRIMAGNQEGAGENLAFQSGDLALRFVSQEIIECVDSQLSQILLKSILFSPH